MNSPEGLDALVSADALTIAHAYMDGTVDFEGDLLEMLRYQELLRDAHPGIYLWRRLHPILVGRPRVNPAWIALHYDAQNAQLHVSDADWHTYTPGIYATEGVTGRSPQAGRSVRGLASATGPAPARDRLRLGRDAAL